MDGKNHRYKVDMFLCPCENYYSLLYEIFFVFQPLRIRSYGQFQLRINSEIMYF
jgi:hypothetical protein